MNLLSTCVIPNSIKKKKKKKKKKIPRQNTLIGCLEEQNLIPLETMNLLK
jgi:hypothetical protein